MSGIAAVGQGITHPQQGIAHEAPSLLARTMACAKNVFATLSTWSSIAISIVAAVVVIKVVAAHPIATVVAALGIVYLYRNRHKIALLAHLYLAMIKDLIGFKKHAWFHQVGEHTVLGAIPLQIKNHPYKFHQMNIKGVISLADEEESKAEAFLVRPVQPEAWRAMNIEFKHLPTSISTPLSICKIDEAVEFIHAHAQRGEKTYIHCADGSGRGALVIACYLIKHKNLSPKDAMTLVKTARPSVVIQTDQLGRIYEYEDHIKNPR